MFFGQLWRWKVKLLKLTCSLLSILSLFLKQNWNYEYERTWFELSKTTYVWSISLGFRLDTTAERQVRLCEFRVTHYNFVLVGSYQAGTVPVAPLPVGTRCRGGLPEPTGRVLGVLYQPGTYVGSPGTSTGTGTVVYRYLYLLVGSTGRLPGMYRYVYLKSINRGGGIWPLPHVEV